MHTHPSGLSEFSEYDDQVDRDLATAARAFGAHYYAAVVIAGTPENPDVTARLYDLGDTFTPDAPDYTVVDAVRVTGCGLNLFLPPTDSDSDGDGETVSAFDRQIRMLGPEGDRTLKQVRAAIVGAGGTGTAVGVQIARLGLGEVVLVDDDVVTEPTPTLGHGWTTADLGRPKVDVLADHLEAIGLGTTITKVNKPLHDAEAIAAIAHAEVLFSCVDGHGARVILNRWAFAHIAPVIDVAVLVTRVVTSDGNRKVEIEQRVTWVAPGTACLLCRGRIGFLATGVGLGEACGGGVVVAGAEFEVPGGGFGVTGGYGSRGSWVARLPVRQKGSISQRAILQQLIQEQDAGKTGC